MESGGGAAAAVFSNWGDSGFIQMLQSVFNDGVMAAIYLAVCSAAVCCAGCKWQLLAYYKHARAGGEGVDCKMCSVLRPEPTCQRGRASPCWIPPAAGAAAASSLSAPEQRMAVASPVRAFLPRHPDQARRAWIATGETAALPGTPSGKAETSLSPCIPIDQGACLPPWNPAASSADLMHVTR